MRAALIDESGVVENIIELPDDYDPEVEGAYLPPEGYTIAQDDEGQAKVNGIFAEGSWEEPPAADPPPPTEVERLCDQLESLQDQADAQLTDTFMIYDILINGGLL